MTEYSLASQTYVEIGGVNITDYCMSWEFSSGISYDIDEAHLVFKNDVQDVLTFRNNMEVIIKRGKTTGSEYYVFRGFISTFSPKGTFFEVIAKDKLWQLQRRQVNTVYENTDSFGGNISLIAKDLIETYGELDADVEDTGGYFVFTKFWCRNDKVFERLQTLRKVCNFSLMYDPENDLVTFKSKGYETHPFILEYNTIGTCTTTSILKWDWDIENILNSITIIGGAPLENKKETFSGTGSTDTFTISYIPEVVQVDNPSGTRKTLGVLNGTITASYDYYVDKTKKQIIFVKNTSAGSSNVIVDYNAYVPVIVLRNDSTSITDYGLSEDTFYYPDILTTEDAEVRANELLERFKSATPSCGSINIFQTEVPIRPGQNIYVNDQYNNVTRYLTVLRITYRWPGIYDVIDLGQEPIQDRMTGQTMSDRISQIEKLQASEISYVTQIEEYQKDMRMIVDMEIRYIDSSLDGAWGKGFSDLTTRSNYTWGESGGLYQSSYVSTEEIVHAICQQDNQWEEEIIDTDYIIAEETTAIIDTTNGEIRFT